MYILLSGAVCILCKFSFRIPNKILQANSMVDKYSNIVFEVVLFKCHTLVPTHIYAFPWVVM